MNGYTIKRTKKVQSLKLERRELERARDKQRAQWRDARALKRCAPSI